MAEKYQSWGKYPNIRCKARKVYWRTDPLEVEKEQSALPFGRGRSYGDSCLNDQGILLDTSRLNHFIEFDRCKGILSCESGVTFEEILRLIIPFGWFLPVTPGTKFVTVGGAIANDIHGKNHHKAGTFGRHVTQFELLRSNGERLICTPVRNRGMFRATIGGLGLTGLILRAEIKLKKINTPFIDVKTFKFKNIEEFFELSMQAETDYEYTVAWIDCLSSGNKLGRGLLMCGNHSDCQMKKTPMILSKKYITIPFDLPEIFLNRFTIKAFNTVYYHKKVYRNTLKTTYYEPFFYPLDAINCWNRLYGRKGVFQYQTVVPCDNFTPIRSILSEISRSGMGSFLSVLKTFGDVESPGMLSFPRKGVTLALDFPNKGQSTLDLLERLDRIVRDYHGSVYPAKDARMSSESFNIYYPHVTEFLGFVDPKFSSNFWRRVTKPDLN